MITITYPYKGMVFQRANDGAAYVNVRGLADSAKVTISFTPVQSTWGTAVEPQTVQVTNGKFEAWVKVPGGDYTLRVNNDLDTQIVTPVGVGEVLLLWGHSFIAGDPGWNRDAADPRSRTVKTKRSDTNPLEPTRLQDFALLPLDFGPINQEYAIGPFSVYTWMWGMFADALVQKLNVPVLLYSAAFGGSQVYMNLLNIENKPFDHPFFGGLEQYRMPYRPVEAVMQKYAQLTGLRGVICEHGGNDGGLVTSGKINIANVFPKVVNHSRSLLGHEKLIWTISLEGNAFLDANASILNDQLKQVLATLPNAYKGIDLSDPSTVGSWRDNNGTGHFRGLSGAQKYLDLWLNAIKPDFFTSSTPYLILPPSAATVTNAPEGSTDSSLLANFKSDSLTGSPKWYQNENVQLGALIVWGLGLLTLAGLFALKFLKANR